MPRRPASFQENHGKDIRGPRRYDRFLPALNMPFTLEMTGVVVGAAMPTNSVRELSAELAVQTLPEGSTATPRGAASAPKPVDGD